MGVGPNSRDGVPLQLLHSGGPDQIQLRPLLGGRLPDRRAESPEIGSQEIDQIMEEAWNLPGESIVTYLQRYENEGRLAASRFTSWNVPATR